MAASSGDKEPERLIPKGDDFLSAEELRALSPDVLRARCRALILLLREDAAEAETLRRPTARCWNAIRKSGFFYLQVPKKYGGLEADVDTVFDCVLAISEGDPSVGWLCALSVIGNKGIASFPPEVQDELFANGRYLIESGGPAPLGKAVPVEGGYCITGEWQWGTSSIVADWMQLFCALDTEDGPKVGSFLTRAENAKLKDTWHTIGARATGTHVIVVNDVFVPERHVNFRMARDGKARAAELYKGEMYRAPVAPLLAFMISICIIGCAKTALALYKEHLTRHTKRGTAMREAEGQPSQIRLALSDTKIAMAALLAKDAMKQSIAGWHLAEADQLPLRNAMRARICLAVQQCREAVLTICEATGTSIHYLDNPLQRCFRDMMVMSSHIVFDFDVTMEQHGRSQLGLPPTSVLV
jgi:alkylation response protein AidB-like acyl-CoA dehydrogenase